MKNSKIPLACPNKFHEFIFERLFHEIELYNKRPLFRYILYDMMFGCSRESHSGRVQKIPSTPSGPAKWSGSTTWHDAHAPTRNRGRGGAARRRVFVSLIPSHSPSRRGRRDPLAGRRALTLSASLRTPCHAQAASRGAQCWEPTRPSPSRPSGSRRSTWAPGLASAPAKHHCGDASRALGPFCFRGCRWRSEAPSAGRQEILID